jgi:hypothetical protein
MNRRQAIGRIFITGTGAAALLAGNGWYNVSHHPDLSYLDRNKELIAALAETIIPATDSPGAKEAEVDDFIIRMVKDCTESKTQNRFLFGLKDLKLYCISKYNKQFQQCSPDIQTEVLEYFEKKGKPFRGLIGKAHVRYLGQPFFLTLKNYTVEGYCTSMKGASEGLAYVHVPGSYQACIMLKPGQKAWATN